MRTIQNSNQCTEKLIPILENIEKNSLEVYNDIIRLYNILNDMEKHNLTMAEGIQAIRTIILYNYGFNN